MFIIFFAWNFVWLFLSFPVLCLSSALVAPTVPPSGSTLESIPGSGSLRPVAPGSPKRCFDNSHTVFGFFFAVSAASDHKPAALNVMSFAIALSRLWLIMDVTPLLPPSSTRWTSSWRLWPTLTASITATPVWVCHSFLKLFITFPFLIEDIHSLYILKGFYRVFQPCLGSNLS